MNKCKRLKDPLYGYVEVPAEISKGIIDSAVFQRLRRIIQTSYAPLYSSSVHNRFIHSLGVFHLGKIAANAICKQVKIKKINISNLENIVEIFSLACLLHDVGHAPFSHTGEKFYLDDTNLNKYASIHNRLKEVVGSECFSKDVPTDDSHSAAPHEVMSSIVGISSFGTFLSTAFEKEFFARCITGYKYSILSNVS